MLLVSLPRLRADGNYRESSDFSSVQMHTIHIFCFFAVLWRRLIRFPSPVPGFGSVFFVAQPTARGFPPGRDEGAQACRWPHAYFRCRPGRPAGTLSGRKFFLVRWRVGPIDIGETHPGLLKNMPTAIRMSYMFLQTIGALVTCGL